MTTTAEDWTLENQRYADPSILPTNHRREILTAIIECASMHGGEVHASWVRPLLPEGVNQALIGNVMSHLANVGILVNTRRTLPSGDTRSRNRTKRLAVRRVADWARLIEEVTR